MHYQTLIFSGSVHNSVFFHKPTHFIEHFFSSIIQSKQKEIEEFFHISLLKGRAIQILEYLPGGFYKRHADNASELIKDNRVVGYKEQRKERKLTTLLFLNDDFLLLYGIYRVGFSSPQKPSSPMPTIID